MFLLLSSFSSGVTAFFSLYTFAKTRIYAIFYSITAK